MAFAHGFKSKANRIALAVREKMSLRPSSPIDPVEICRLYEFELFTLSKVPCDCQAFLGEQAPAFSAMTISRGIRTLIVHNDSHHPNRQRSNICHEIAHRFLGHKDAPPLNDEGQRMHDGGIEAEANFLAGTLLIPNEAAIRIAISQMDPLAAQRHYGVSADMLEFRLRMSGAHKMARRSRRSP